MADLVDVANVIGSALAEVGVTGRFVVTSPEGRFTSWLGEPGGDDVSVTVAVASLHPDADAAASR